MTEAPIGGYPVRHAELLDAKYRCKICSHVFRDPVQLTCGHRICFTCFPRQPEVFKCELCEEVSETSQVRLDKGFRKDMEILEVTCGFCDWIGQLKNYQTHLESLHKQYQCSYCNAIFNCSSLFHEHDQKLCSKKPVDCPLQSCGCKDQIPRGELGEHYLTVQHQASLLSCIDQLIGAYKASVMNSDGMETETSTSSTQMSTRSSSMTGPAEQQDDMERFLNMVGVLANGSRLLSSELVRLTSDSTEMSQSVEKIEKLLAMAKTSTEQFHHILSAMHMNLTICEQELSSLKGRFEDQRVSSVDGTLVWKITDVRSKLNDARSERQTSIYSPPFRSSPTGYVMRARLYLYGDGNARRTHMSLFYVLMRGPHDSILQYPFNAKVTFCLFDQTPAKSHIVESFRPDTKSNSFQKPRSDMNIASGIPKFAPLQIFEQPDNPYVRDDTMFIKVTVDFENMAKSTIAFVSKLNPGLPVHVQRKMAQHEIELKAQQPQPTTQPTLVTTGGKAETN